MDQPREQSPQEYSGDDTPPNRRDTALSRLQELNRNLGTAAVDDSATPVSKAPPTGKPLMQRDFGDLAASTRDEPGPGAVTGLTTSQASSPFNKADADYSEALLRKPYDSIPNDELTKTVDFKSLGRTQRFPDHFGGKRYTLGLVNNLKHTRNTAASTMMGFRTTQNSFGSPVPFK